MSVKSLCESSKDMTFCCHFLSITVFVFCCILFSESMSSAFQWPSCKRTLALIVVQVYLYFQEFHWIAHHDFLCTEILYFLKDQFLCVWVWLKYESTFSMPLFWKGIINSLKTQSRFHISLFNPYFYTRKHRKCVLFPAGDYLHTESNLVWKVGNLESKECIICLQMTTGIKWPIFLGLSAIPQSSLKLFFPMLWADPAIHQDLWAINKTIHENLLCSVVYLRQGKCKYFSITWLCRFLFATLKYQHIKKKSILVQFL